MSLLQELRDRIGAFGVLVTVDFPRCTLRFEPRGVLPPDVLEELETNAMEFTVMVALSDVLEPKDLVLVLNALSAKPQGHSGYWDDEDAGQRLSEGMRQGEREGLFAALESWVALVRAAYHEALADDPDLHTRSAPIWMWWTRYTVAGASEPSPLAALFEAEIGFPGDGEDSVQVAPWSDLKDRAPDPVGIEVRA